MANHMGGCQCGAVRYRVDVSLDNPIICNCSRCSRIGSVLVFAPAAAFTLETPEDASTAYHFNKHVVEHLFCKTCGVQSYSRGKMPDGSEAVAINARCLDGVDGHALAAGAQMFDGASA